MKRVLMIARKASLFSVVFMMCLFNCVYCSATVIERQINSEHKIGDKIGNFKKSSTKVLISVNCIEHNLDIEYKYIPIYTIKNELCIVLEDLNYYGYTSIWNQENRTTTLYIDDNNINKKGTKKVIKEQGDIYYTDIKTYIDGYEITSYNINGYSLVKISDLTTIAQDLRFKKELKDNESITISGKIKLCDGDTAPEDGMKVTPVFYYFNSGTLEKYIENQYVIPEGCSEVDYRIELPVYKYWNKMGFDNANIYNYMGYQIDNSTVNENYISYNITNNNPNNIYLQQLNSYNETYQNEDIKILSKQKVKIRLELTGDSFGIFKDEYRSIRICATDVESNQVITQEKSVNCNQNIIEFELDLIKNKKYKLNYTLMVFGGLGRNIPPLPRYPTFYNNDGRGEVDETLSEIIELNEQSSIISTSIKLPNIIIGDVYKSDKKFIFNLVELRGYKIGGKYLLKTSYSPLIKSAKDVGTSIGADINSNVFRADETSMNIEEKSLGKLLLSNRMIHLNSNKIPEYWVDIDGTLEEVILVEDLEKVGFDIIFEEDIIKISKKE